MTEHEKMLAGKIYDPFAEGMPEERTNAHRLCKLYNDTLETETERRREILDKLLPDRGENVYLQGPIYFDFGTNTVIGSGSYANFNFTVLDEGRVTIGSSVFIGPNVSLLTAIHPLCYQDRNSFVHPKTGVVTDLEYTAPIVIEDNCWIAGGVTICGGVTIGGGLRGDQGYSGQFPCRRSPVPRYPSHYRGGPSRRSSGAVRGVIFFSRGYGSKRNCA